MVGEDATQIRFPDVPKLELDQLIDQLVEVAAGVKRTQGRLRTLLHAIETVAGDLTTEAVLRNVVEAGCRMVSAEYGALGVIGADGGLAQFIHVGIDDATVRRIGHLPEGKGLLGALIIDPRPIRLEHISDDARSAGFPADHPPMESFLGVPIRVRGEVFGNLYLTNSAHGHFTSEDEELIKALAVAAGTAIANARLYQESRLQQRWLTASVEIGAQVLTSTGEDPLQTIARRAFDIAEADLVSVGLLTADGTEIVIETAVGEQADDLVARRFPLAGTFANKAVTEREAVLLHSADAAELRSFASEALDVGPLMVLPLMRAETVRGVLALVRARGRHAFTAADLNMAAGFANHASVALELADARAAEERVILLEDRERIARDLHDHVIQELFAIGLSLEGTAAVISADHPARRRIQQRVEDLDRTIRRIRTSIFELRGAEVALPGGIRERIIAVAADLTPALGFSPSVIFGGAVDAVLTPELGDDVVACVRESLTNVARHAQASRADVDLTVAAEELTVTVTDNGVGISPGGRHSGLTNLRHRAETRGGSFDISPGTATGTRLTWKVPLR
jgi:signal transduction histidine kinase